MAIAALHGFLGEELKPAQLDRIEAVWRGNDPPTDHVRRIRNTLRAPNEWRTLYLLSAESNQSLRPCPKGRVWTESDRPPDLEGVMHSLPLIVRRRQPARCDAG